MRVRDRLAYGAPAFALALFGVPVFVHLPKFYADVIGVPLSALGVAILLTRSWDALLDPVIGVLSDRTRTRWGRRRPYLLLAPIPLAVAVVLLFAPASDRGVWWFAGAMTLAFLAWTLVHIPYQALGPELTSDHHERTSLFAVRDGLWIAGTLVAAVAPAIVARAIGAGPTGDGERATFAMLGAIYAVLLIALPWLCAFTIRERYVPPPEKGTDPFFRQGPPKKGSVPFSGSHRALREALANRPFRLLLAAYAIGALGGALPGTLLFFYVEHVLRAPAHADLFLGLYFLSGFVCLPLWTALARRVGKKRAFVFAMAVSVVVFSGAFLLGPGATAWFTVIVVLSGSGFGASLALPSSMQADTIDLDELETGARREGLFLGLWSVVTKGSAAIGAGLALPILGAAGYVAGSPQTDEVTMVLRVLYCLVPCACYVAAVIIINRYPLDEAAHDAILSALEQKGTVPISSRS